MNVPRKALIIEDSPIFSKPLCNQLIGEGYDVIEIISKVYDAIELIYIYNPDLITLDLMLEDGTGLSVIEQLASNVQKLKKRPFVAVISENISIYNKNYITNRLAECKVGVLYFDKLSTFYLQHLSETLSKLDGYFSNNGNLKISIIEETACNADILSSVIRKKLRDYSIIEDSQSFEHLVFLIQESLMNPPEKFSMTKLYERAQDIFKIEPDSIAVSIKRVNLVPTPKKFIIRMMQELKEEYADFGR